MEEQKKSEGENDPKDGLAGGLKNSKGENGQKDGLAGEWKNRRNEKVRMTKKTDSPAEREKRMEN